MSTLIFLDTETGGLDPATDSLLSIGLVAYNPATGAVLDEREILVWDDELRKDPEALRVNGIDPDIHRPAAISRETAARLVEHFVRPEWRRATLVCHNAPFDLGFIRPLLGVERFERLFWHQVLDTMAVVLFLSHVGRLPRGIASLQRCAEYFRIVAQGRAHTALADAKTTLQLYERLCVAVRGDR